MTAHVGLNVSIISGTLIRPPTVRDLPSGASVASFELRSTPGQGPAESVPVAWYDPPSTALALCADEELLVLGRVRRRFFRSGGATQSRTEVVAEAIVPLRQRARARRLLERALGVIDTPPG